MCRCMFFIHTNEDLKTKIILGLLCITVSYFNKLKKSARLETKTGG